MSENNPAPRGKIIPYKRRGVATPNNSENDMDDTDEDVDHDSNRLRDVEKSVQDTREQMLQGFGDVNAAIERTNANIERTRADMIERNAGSETRMVERIAAAEKDMIGKVSTAEKDLGDKLHLTQKELGEKIGGRSWLIMSILLAALLGGIGIATAILIAVIQKN